MGDTTGATMAIPDGAACYFCLGEEEDEEGMPLVRNCSCRGDSGFAHLDCLVKYAEQKSKQAVDGNLVAFSEPWHKCNNCRQPFQGKLAIDLSSACVSFAEATYGHPSCSKWDKLKIIESLRLKIDALNKADADVEELNDKLMTIIDQTKTKYKVSRWIHMPKTSNEYQYFKALCGHYEAYAYKQLGGIIMQAESFKIASMHYKKARAIYNLVGMTDLAKEVDAFISMYTDTPKKQAANDGYASSSRVTSSIMSPALTNSLLHISSALYKRFQHTHGMDSANTIKAGLNYAKVLQSVSCIEAERLVTKLAAISRRVHGPDHKITSELVKLLKECKVRYVLVLPENKPFQALRYENDGEICVVTGPITMPKGIYVDSNLIVPRNKDDERTYRVENSLIVPTEFFTLCCPVICHGLVSASHLNGELGEVRNMKPYEAETTQLAVHFEKKNLKSALVKPANLRIAFELPDEVEKGDFARTV